MFRVFWIYRVAMMRIKEEIKQDRKQDINNI